MVLLKSRKTTKQKWLKTKTKKVTLWFQIPPSELWKEWSNFQQSKCSFAQRIEDTLFDDETGEGPEIEDIAELTGRLLVRLRNVHFDTLQDDELPPVQRKLWKDDLKCLDKALRNVRAMN